VNIPTGHEPAFPFQCQGQTTGPEIYYGMTLRAYFAGQALHGICARAFPNKEIWEKPFVEYAAPFAVELADALIAELRKEKP
jgi:hypothetical protein